MLRKSRSERPRKAVLVLEDGTIFLGRGIGATKKTSGEVVFSTGMVGYPEALTDPSYHGQILTLTYPLVGNYGVPPKDKEFNVLKYFESESIKVRGLVIHDLCDHPHHWTSTKTLDKWLKDENVPGIFGIDTRWLTKRLRVHGVMLGILKVCEEEEPDVERLSEEAKTIPDPNLRDLVKEVTIKKPLEHGSGGNRKVVLIDCGVKHGILRSLLNRGIDVVRVPHFFSTEKVLEYKPDGVVVSNGPGDPKKCKKVIDCVQGLVEERVPIMGICFGTQMLALALGGDTYKLKYGHRSHNQPVLDLETGRCYITAQNHGYAVNPSSLEGTDLKVCFINVNDKTVEGVRHANQPTLGFQWHPEASPGPLDSTLLIDEFLKGCLTWKRKQKGG